MTQILRSSRRRSSHLTYSRYRACSHTTTTITVSRTGHPDGWQLLYRQSRTRHCPSSSRPDTSTSMSQGASKRAGGVPRVPTREKENASRLSEVAASCSYVLERARTCSYVLVRARTCSYVGCETGRESERFEIYAGVCTYEYYVNTM